MTKPSDINGINRTDEILRFVKGNPRSTKADVIRHMKGKSAVRTTHAILIELIKEGKIIEDKKHVQTHLLSINEDNEFSKFHKLLSDIETLINDTKHGFPSGINYDPDGSIYIDTGTSTIFPGEDDEQYSKLNIALQGLQNVYRQSFFLMIQILYNEIEISRSIGNRRDKVILFRKLNYLNGTLALYPWDKKFANELLGNCTKNMKKYLKDYDRYTYVKGRTNSGDKLIEAIENFKSKFLAKPHEKSS